MNTIVKRAYDLFPFKRQAFVLMKYFYHPPQALYQRLNFDGPFQVRILNGKFILQNYAGHDHFLENEIFWNGLSGGWERTSLALWSKLCSSAKTIFDIGANTGIYSLIAKTVHPESNVYAFEPMPQIFRELQTNIRLNKYDVKVFDVAVSNRDGAQTLFHSGGGHTYTASLNRGFDENTNELAVPTMKLSTFIRQQQLSAVDLMKIDVETHEAEVLLGMEEYLDSMKPTLLVEILTNELGEKIETILAGRGYDYYAIDEINGPSSVDNLRAVPCRNYLVCTPEKGQMLGLKMRAGTGFTKGDNGDCP